MISKLKIVVITAVVALSAVACDVPWFPDVEEQVLCNAQGQHLAVLFHNIAEPTWNPGPDGHVAVVVDTNLDGFDPGDEIPFGDAVGTIHSFPRSQTGNTGLFITFRWEDNDGDPVGVQRTIDADAFGYELEGCE